jgi:hypothetical protein
MVVSVPRAALPGNAWTFSLLTAYQGVEDHMPNPFTPGYVKVCRCNIRTLLKAYHLSNL